MNKVTRNRELAKTSICDESRELSNKLPAKASIKRKTSFLLPLVLCSFFGEPALASAEGLDPAIPGHPQPAQLERLRAQAAQGDLDAIYWLAMLHIEGKISGADYSTGTGLLRRAADQGHSDASRMWSFMHNAFSGEGC